MEKMKLIAIVTCYNPSPELLLRSIASYAMHVDKLLVWRNSLLPEDLESELSQQFKAEFRGDGKNVGISSALNAAWKEAVTGEYDYLLTMDQDSIWHGFEAFLAQVLSNGLSMSFYSPLTLMMGDAPTSSNKTLLVPADIVLTSGMLIPVNVLNIIGGWDERFTVEAVDVDFCLHARTLGIQCLRCGAGWLEHRLGNRLRVSFLWFHFNTYNYSPERLYGIYRNHITALRRYKGGTSKHARSTFVRGWIWRQPIRILLGEKKRQAKFHAILRGIKDGFLA